jgi:hypothetical protein
MSKSEVKLTRKQIKQLREERKDALLKWFKVVRRKVKIGVACDESFIGVVNFSKRSSLSVSLYKLGTSITRETTKKYVFDTTGDILDVEHRAGGSRYQFLKDRCFAIRIKPSNPARPTPEHHFSLAKWKEEVSYNIADHFMTIELKLKTPMERSEKTRLFGKIGTVYKP